MPFSLLQYNIVSYALLLPVIVNLFAWQSPIVARLFGGLFFIFQVFILGQLILPQQPFFRRLVPGLMAFLVILLLLSTAIYIVWDLSPSAQSLVFLLFPAAVSAFFARRYQPRQAHLELHTFSWKDFDLPPPLFFLCAAYGFLLIWLFVIVGKASTVQAIASPWALIPSHFWVLYVLASVILLLMCWYGTIPRFSQIAVSAHLFFSFTIGLIFYRLGFGFDPFIHQATEALIAQQGAVLPKNPYYLGQYSLIVSLHRLLGFSIVWLDRLLVPMLAALSLPALWQEVLAPQTQGQPQGLKNSHWLALTVFLVPLAALTVTTPHSLANLFFLWCVIASFALVLNTPVTWNVTMLWAVAAAALLTHPLAGSAALILLAVVSYELHKDNLRLPAWFKRSLRAEIFVFGSVLVPALFLLHGFISEQSTTRLGWPNLARWQTFLSSFPTYDVPYRTVFFDLAYTLAGWLPAVIASVTLAVSLWLLLKYKTVLLRVYVMTAVILLINAFLVASSVELPEVIDYESFDYARRLLVLASWSLLPLMAVAFIWLYRVVSHRSPVYIWMVILGMTWLMASNLFASYPRQNRYEISHQYNSSSADFAVVNYIAQKQKSDYVVLANQNVSAAAIAAYGFKTYYYQGGREYFYYPLPTSSPLYQTFLDMAYEAPSRDNAKKAAVMTGASTVYFVLNAYWTDAADTAQRAKLEADEWTAIENGAAYVFTYRFHSL